MPSPRSRTATGIATLLTLLTLAQTSLTSPLLKRTTAGMSVISHCPYPVWAQIVPQNGGNPPWKLMSPGYTFPWSDFPPLTSTDCDGVSIKLGLQDFTGLIPSPITQVEVAWNNTAGSVIYDVSDLNAYGPSPFYKQGYVLWSDKPSSDAFPLCQTIHCGAGENPCTGVYWYGEPVYSDGESIVNHIHTCPDSANLVFEVCSG